MRRYYFYIEWEFIHPPAGLDGPGPYHTTLETDCPKLDLSTERMRSLKVIQFDTREEMKAFWDKVS